jgi:hypothetical protein
MKSINLKLSISILDAPFTLIYDDHSTGPGVIKLFTAIIYEFILS